MENGKMMLSMDMESIIEMMEISMKVNGKMILEMEKELLQGKMEINMREIG